MKKFWGIVVILLLLVIGYQFMKSTQLSSPGNMDITGTVQHYVSDVLGVQFDYMDYIDNNKITAVETGKTLLLGGTGAGIQSMQVMSHDPAQSLELFLKTLLTGADKRCSFALKTGTYLTDMHAQQLIVVNTSPWKYLGQGEDVATGAAGTMCKSMYDIQDGLKFFAFDPRTPAVVYFFTIGQDDSFAGTFDLRTPWYQTLTFLATGDVVGVPGVAGPISDDSTGHINLIKKYYNALQTHDFVTAASLLASGENDAITLQNNYGKAVELLPFKIEQVGDGIYQFYVRYLNAGASQPSIYSLKKTVIDGKLKSVSGGKIVTNASNDFFRYYSDQFIDMAPKTFKVLDLFTAADLAKSDCTRPATKNLAYFKNLLSVFTAKDLGTKYTVNFKNLGNIEEQAPDGLQSATIYVIPNKIKYPSKDAFFQDFDKCMASTTYAPALITLDSMIFVDGCGEQDKGYCNDIAAMFKQTLKAK